MVQSTEWREAHDNAQLQANTYRRPMAVEKADEFGKTVYRVRFLPIDPMKRFGWETRCEVVDPERRAS